MSCVDYRSDSRMHPAFSKEQSTMSFQSRNIKIDLSPKQLESFEKLKQF